MSDNSILKNNVEMILQQIAMQQENAISCTDAGELNLIEFELNRLVELLWPLRPELT
jgi:hypothetical protein